MEIRLQSTFCVLVEDRSDESCFWTELGLPRLLERRMLSSRFLLFATEFFFGTFKYFHWSPYLELSEEWSLWLVSEPF